MSEAPLMPKATAVWLIENTALTFDQIANFCVLHPLEVKGIADGDVAGSVRGIDPIAQHQLTREEIEKGEADSSYRLKLSRQKTVVPAKSKKAPRYTPVSKRQNRPDAIAWMVRNHPEVSDAQISKLLGTTKATIVSIRDRTHWNSSNLQPRDPVALGLCSQIDLDLVVKKAAAKNATKETKVKEDEGPTLRPAEQSVKPTEEPSADQPPQEPEKEGSEAEKVFANFADSPDGNDG